MTNEAGLSGQEFRKKSATFRTTSVLDAPERPEYLLRMKHGMLRILGVLWLAVVFPCIASAKETPAQVRKVDGIPYYPAETKVEDPEKRCLVDLRLPENANNFPTLVWFHGGGLTGGKRDFPPFEGSGVALVSAGYRLAPPAKCPDFLTDAAAAVAWTLKHIGDYGGDPKRIFIGGHSAGGYLSAMVAMDPKWLAAQGLSNKQLAGVIPVSAQVTTHFHVKELLGIKADPLVPMIDEYAPLHFVSKDLPPICLITGERKLDWPCRVEENELLFATLRKLGHPAVEFHENKDLDHNTVTQAAAKTMPEFIARVSAKAP